MKKLVIMFLTFGIQIFLFSQSKSIEERVQELLSKMTIEEKVGQMTQVTLQAVSKTQGTKIKSINLMKKN